MYMRCMKSGRGYSLQFCDMEEANAILEFIATYPDSTGRMKHLSKYLRSNLSDKYANEVTKVSMPLWFEDVPDVITALWIAYASWDSSEQGQRFFVAIGHDDELYAKRMAEANKHTKQIEKLISGALEKPDNENKSKSDRDKDSNE